MKAKIKKAPIIKKQITVSVRSARDFKLVLEENMDKILRPSFFRKVPLGDKINYLRAIAEAKSILWASVYRDFPETLGKEVTVTDCFIEWKE